MTPPIPTPEQAERASDMLSTARHWLDEIIGYRDAEEQRAWSRATGHLQDALAELGFDLVPLKKAPPATAESLFGPADYAASVGGL